MGQVPVPLPTGFRTAVDFPKARENLVNCFFMGENKILSRPGIQAQNTGTGNCRGAADFKGRLFHASAQNIIIVPEDLNIPPANLGAIGGADLVFFDPGHTMMMILARGGDLLKWEDTGGNGTLTNVTGDSNFLTSVDMAFMDGRWFYCPADGGPIIYSEVGDGGDIRPDNFFDAELLPDDNLGLINVRNTLYVLGEGSIELFRTRVTLNAAGQILSVVQRVEGGQIQSGYIGGRIEYGLSFAYVGRNLDGHAGIFVAGTGEAQKISNDAVDDVLQQYSLPELTLVKAQRYTWHGQDTVIFTFLNETLAFSGGVWHFLTSDNADENILPWRAVFNSFSYGRYYVGDLETADIGILTDIDSDYGVGMDRQIDTFFRLGPNTQFVVSAAELEIRMGLVPNVDPDWGVGLSLSRDGIVYGPEIYRSMGREGNYAQRLQWRGPGGLGNYESFMGIRLRVRAPIEFSTDALFLDVVGG